MSGYSINKIKKNRFQSGLTLPELMITLTVMAILVSLSAPSVRSLISDRQVASVARVLHTSLMMARSEAVKRSATVSLCKSDNGSSCDDDLADWSKGWLIFADENANGEFDSADDKMIRVYAEQDELDQLDWNKGDNLSFDSRGRLNVINGTFSVCKNLATEFEQRDVVLIGSGRARILEVTGDGQCS
ncbi:hypothetical protein EOPP23_12050 [Endozoicomonas sp. OPT23]|uniref:GspH/FimT family pseudopilin n=1 Tax=Endozoicomonas sp. OPT23 TaxID=2072845 RepID=UPI00129AB639|nr:GspH/FimT family pseudopilin [Endozoicomonas sp. OPT23]MRI33719.1 hypothetical protein [Endozoicomonas sp. OPT23]